MTNCIFCDKFLLSNNCIKFDFIIFLQFGLVTFSYVATNIFYLNSYDDKNQLQSAILNTPYVGSYTNTSGGIRTATYEQFISSRGDRGNANNIAIIITDGVPNRDESFTIPDAEYLRSLGTMVYVVGITNAIDESMLQDMSSMPQVSDNGFDYLFYTNNMSR